jgi:hypothetical protein
MKPTATDTLEAKLTPAQHTAIGTLATGGTVAAAATAAGVDRVTVWRWRTANAEFAAELNRALCDQAAVIETERRALASEAIATIRDLMGADAPPVIRLRAAQAALDAAGGFAVPGFGETAADALKQEWAHAAKFRSLMTFGD